MSRCSPCRPTPATLAARHANALKSTGPLTVRGKARVGLNALKGGLHAAQSPRLRDRLIRAGYDRREALYGHFRSRIAQTFGASTPEQSRLCDGLAIQVWCLTIRPHARRLLARIKLKSRRKQKGLELANVVRSTNGRGGQIGQVGD